MSVSNVKHNYDVMLSEVVPVLAKARKKEQELVATIGKVQPDLLATRKRLKMLCEELETREQSALFIAKIMRDDVDNSSFIQTTELLKPTYDHFDDRISAIEETRTLLKALRKEMAALEVQFLTPTQTENCECNALSVFTYEEVLYGRLLCLKYAVFHLLTDAQSVMKVANAKFKAHPAPPFVPKPEDLRTRATTSGGAAQAATAHLDLTRRGPAVVLLSTGNFPPPAFFKAVVHDNSAAGSAAAAPLPQQGTGSRLHSRFSAPAPAAASSQTVTITLGQMALDTQAPISGKQQPQPVRDLTSAIGALTLDLSSQAPSPLVPQKRIITAAMAAAAGSASGLPVQASPEHSPELVTALSAPVSLGASPLPSPSPNSGNGFHFGGAIKKKAHRRAASAHMDSASMRYDAFERLKKEGHFPHFRDIMLLVNIEQNYQLRDIECNHLVKFRNKLPQASTESWKQFVARNKTLAEYNKGMREAVLSTTGLAPSSEAFPAALLGLIADYAAIKSIEVQGASGKKYTLQEYEETLPVHFTRVEYADRILGDVQTAGGDQEKLLANRQYIMNTTPKMCVSLMQSGKTCSYYSSQPKKWPGLGLVVALADSESVVHAHNKDSYSPTYFQVPGVEAATQKDSSQAVDFFNNFWLRFSVVRSYVDTICQNMATVFNPDPIRRQMVWLKSELSIIGASHNVLAALQAIVDAAYTTESVGAAFAQVKSAVLELTRERAPKQNGAMAADAIELARAAAKSVAQKKATAFIAVFQKVFPTVQLPLADAANVEKVFDAVTADLMRQVQALQAPREPSPLENKSALLANLTEAIKNIQSMRLEQGSTYEKWIFQQIFKRVPEAGESTLEELLRINEFLAKLCAENMPKLRKAGDKEQDMTIFGQLASPDALIAQTRANDYNEVNILTATAKAVGLGVPSFNGVVIEEYMLEEGKIPAAVETVLTKAEALKLPIYLMRSVK